jgi:pyrimidine-nucleoside phosphorylase/thymidine phosphorylase
MTPSDVIRAKRDGQKLTADVVRSFVDRFVRGEVADYQMSALCMAVYLRGLDDAETWALTEAMLHSGRVLDLSSVPGQKVDKHSTGGVGDKVSICLAPLVAAAGVKVPMISGRGLGHTGGTLDKLEAIPGFDVRLPVERFVAQVAEVGCALVGQTDDLAPADRRMYALRDVTATVESIPLITASILSKKLAEGIDALVLDVKVGRGAFMESRARARALARSLVRCGKRGGKKVVAILTSMDEPLGRAVGNALETAEAIDVLRGGGPRDLVELTLVFGAEMLVLGGVAKSIAQARSLLSSRIADGTALEKLRTIVRAQGGDPAAVDDPSRMGTAPVIRPVSAPKRGFVRSLDARAIGLAAMSLGAGRRRAEDAIDPAVGIVLEKKIGDAVHPGEPLARVHAKTEADAERAAEEVAGAYAFAARRAHPARLVLERIS